HAIGKVQTLQDAVEPLAMRDRNLKPVKQRYETAFSLYQVSDGLASEFICDPDRAFDKFNSARADGTAARYSGYFASAFRLKAPKAKSDAVTLIWRKEGKYWKVISWDVEPEEAATGNTPDTRRRRKPKASSPTEMQSGADPAFLHASHDFLNS